MVMSITILFLIAIIRIITECVKKAIHLILRHLKTGQFRQSACVEQYKRQKKSAPMTERKIHTTPIANGHVIKLVETNTETKDTLVWALIVEPTSEPRTCFVHSFISSRKIGFVNYLHEIRKLGYNRIKYQRSIDGPVREMRI